MIDPTYSLYIVSLYVEFTISHTNKQKGISYAFYLKKIPLILNNNFPLQIHQKTKNAICKSIAKQKKASLSQVEIKKITIHEYKFSSKIYYSYDGN